MRNCVALVLNVFGVLVREVLNSLASVISSNADLDRAIRLCRDLDARRRGITVARRVIIRHGHLPETVRDFALEAL